MWKTQCVGKFLFHLQSNNFCINWHYKFSTIYKKNCDKVPGETRIGRNIYKNDLNPLIFCIFNNQSFSFISNFHFPFLLYSKVFQIIIIIIVRCCKPSDLTYTIELEKQKLNSFENFIRLKTN